MITLRHINLGKAYLKLDRKKDAIIHFQNALRLEPNNPSALRHVNLLAEHTR